MTEGAAPNISKVWLGEHGQERNAVYIGYLVIKRKL